MSLTLSFDTGYASIGWCVLSSSEKQADIKFLGTGVATFLRSLWRSTREAKEIVAE